MEAQVQYKKGRVRISGEMTVYAIAALKQDLFATLSGHKGAALLDLSEVSEIDTAGLQLLLAARRHTASTGRKLSVLEPSSAVLAALELCQLSELLQTPAAERA
jgi:anti-sigma B factor antagonist